MENKELELVNSAFSKLDKLNKRFKECERIYTAQYEKGTDGENNRTTKRKSTDRKRSKLYVPLVKTSVNILHAIFKTAFMDKCPIEITRVGLRDEHDRVLRDALMGAVRKEWENTSHRIGLGKAVLSALYLPLGIACLFYDEKRGAIRTRFVPVTELAFDECATDIEDVEYVAYRWVQSVRECKDKLESGFYKVDDESELFGHGALNSDRVQMRDLYERETRDQKSVWKLTSFCNKKKVREDYFESLPFYFGYCVESMPNIDEAKRKDEIQVYGTAIPEILKEIQTEYNIKRNQKIDIIENNIDPTFIVDKNAGSLSISDITNRKKFIRCETMNGKGVRDVITTFGEAGHYGLTEEIAMLKDEYEFASGINSILSGQTSPSDRRAMGALQAVNASSSMRIEAMMQTLVDTMLKRYATDFVKLVWRYTSDEEFVRLSEKEDLWEVLDSSRGELDFDIRMNFGTTIANEVKLAQLNTLLGTLTNSQMITPQLLEKLIGEIMILILGENANVEEITQPVMQEQPEEPSLEEMERAALMQGGI